MSDVRGSTSPKRVVHHYRLSHYGRGPVLGFAHADATRRASVELNLDLARLGDAGLGVAGEAAAALDTLEVAGGGLVDEGPVDLERLTGADAPLRDDDGALAAQDRAGEQGVAGWRSADSVNDAAQS